MPRQAADLEEALKKKGGLTLSQLANYDDIITDALVDRVYYWSSIRKLKANYHACRGVREDFVCKILQQRTIIDKDPVLAHKELLELPGLTKYLKSLKSDDEKEHFERHLRKYIHIYLPDCPFEVATTNRYTITTAEACIKARKFIKKGEPIKYLSGIQVEMSEKEEKELSSRTDFSIVLSSRRKRPSLFLGPARFANHDCDSNARLNTSGAHGIHIVARKDIHVGDEIAVTYGADYFGVDNCECLCMTCESLLRNGWDPRGPILKEDSSDEEEDDEEEEEIKKEEEPVPKVQPKVLVKKEPIRVSQERLAAAQAVLRTSPQKRKREGDDESTSAGADDDSDPPPKRKRGRPRKNPENINRLWHDCSNWPQSSKSDNTSPYDGLAQQEVDSPCILDQIFTMLGAIGDRRMGTSPAPRAAEETTPRAAQMSKSAPPSEMLRNPIYRTTASPSQASGLSKRAHHPASRSQESSERSKSDTLSTPQSRLLAPTVRRSGSSLRKVVSADDAEEDIYEIPPSPSPVPTSMKKRPQTSKNARHAIDSSPSRSPPPSHNSSSITSSASSATSVDSFTAGTIQQSICQMLTEDDGTDMTDNAEAGATEDTSEETPEITRRQTRSSQRNQPTAEPSPPIRSIESKETEEDNDSDDDRRGPPRTPKDYTLCRSLLPTTYHRWVECRNCDEHFVQDDAYLTRIACPRCERHSKLYGYQWPKTDKEGKFDTEERVLDHRTIHRFIDPEEERNERKGRKTLADVLRERELSERLGSEESDRSSGGAERKVLRHSPRRAGLRAC